MGISEARGSILAERAGTCAAAVHASVPCITTLAGIQAIVSALTAVHKAPFEVRSLQSYHERVRAETQRFATVKA